SRGATTPSPDPTGPASCTAVARECLRHRRTHRLPSYRRLSRTCSTALLGSVSANNNQHKGPRQPEFHRRDCVGGICTLSVSSRPPARACTVIALSEPLPGKNAFHSELSGFV